MNCRWPWLMWLIAGQVAAIVLLIAFGIWRETVPGLTWILHSGSASQRAQAAMRLGQQGPGAREVLPELLEALQDPDPAVQSAAATAIGRVGGVPALAEAMKSPNPATRVAVLGVLWGSPRDPLNDERKMAILVSALRDPSPQVRKNAARALGGMGAAAAPAVPALSAALYDGDGSVRLAAVDSLAQVGAVEELAKAISSTDATVRRLAISKLPSFGARAIPVLTAALESEDPENVAQAASLLGYMQPPATAAVPALARVLQRPEPLVRMRAVEALEEIGGPDVEAALQSVGDDPDLSVRGAALAALQRMRRRSNP